MTEVVIRAGQDLYRGDTGLYLTQSEGDNGLGLKRFQYFGYHPEAVEQYGIIGVWQVERDLNLLDLSNPETLEYLETIAPATIVDDINLSFRRSGRTIIRDSEAQRDKRISEWICESNYDGYATSVLESEMGGIFHAELMICLRGDGRNPISFQNFLINESTDVDALIDKHRMIEVERERLQRRRRQQREHRSRLHPSDELESSSVKRTLF